MLTDEARKFASEHSKGVITTFRKSGAVQMSIVACTPLGDGVAFTTTEDRAKLINLRRDRRCSLLVSKDDWWGYIVLEGRAEIIDQAGTSRDEFLATCRQIYRQISGEHDNWDEYDQAMIDDRRVVITVVPERVYGTAL